MEGGIPAVGPWVGQRADQVQVFTVTEPPELVALLRELSERYLHAIEPG